MISVLIVDDHALVRETWSFILKTFPVIGSVHECSSGVDALAMVCEVKPDVVLMDINMHPISGIEATERILDSNPEVKVIAVSTYADVSYVRRMFTAGALGYVTKNSPVREMIAAIDSVLKMQTYLCSEIAPMTVF